jgi:undecaprenyl-diphosphatase
MHRPRTSAFPSGHATAAFTAATLLAQGNSAGPFYFGLAALVASSRVYTRMHHASDVLAGAALGFVFGRVARRLLPMRPK